jgi:hypothetical protein
MQMATSTIYINNIIFGYDCQSKPVLFVGCLTTSVNQFWPKSVEILDGIES